MRTKSFPVRSWHKSPRKSLDPYLSPSSLPDEANERLGSTAHCDPHCDSDDANVETVPDTFDERHVPPKKRHCREADIGEFEPVNLDACIVCEILDKWVSHCSGIDCLVSFHEECLNAELGCGEQLAKSYCPYCWFKILALKSKSMREKAVGAENAVFKHLEKEMKSRDEVKESVPKPQEDPTLADDENGNREHSVDSTDIVSDQELQGEKDAYSSKEEQGQVEKDSGKSRDEEMPSIEETDQSEEDKGKLEVGTDKSSDIKEDNMLDSVEASENKEKVDTENFQDAEGDKDDETESFSGKVQQNEKQRRRSRRRRIELRDTDSEISSNESTNEQNGEDISEQKTSSTQVISPSRKTKNEQRKFSATTKVAKSNTVRDISFFKKDQRRRLLWTYEEEEMLKAGVEKFAAEANKNMPWRKILEMGEKVFHETRTPADLKDKWRNMIGGRLGQKTIKTAR